MELFFNSNFFLAIFISLGLNIFIAIAGLIPSAFLTAANIMYFGFSFGLIISIIGEALGALISFYLYRKGLKAIDKKIKNKGNNRYLQKLKNTKGIEAIFLVIGLRILPFVPSGLVTLAASMSKIQLGLFAIASTIGKIPSLWIEAYSVHTVLSIEREYQIGAVFSGLVIVIIYYFLTRRKIKEQ